MVLIRKPARTTAGGGGGPVITLGGTAQGVAQGFLNLIIDGIQSSTENFKQCVACRAYTIQRFTSFHDTNTTPAPDSTIRMRVNNADANQLITITAGTTGVFQDLVNTDALVNQDLYSCFLTRPVAGSFNISGFSLEIVA